MKSDRTRLLFASLYAQLRETEAVPLTHEHLAGIACTSKNTVWRWVTTQVEMAPGACEWEG
jgi:hypothetical protein